MQNRAQIKESKSAKNIPKCANEKRRIARMQLEPEFQVLA